MREKNSETPHVKVSLVFKAYSSGGRIVMPEGDGYSPYYVSKGVPSGVAVRVLGVPSDAKFEVPFIAILDLVYYPAVDYGRLEVGESFSLLEGPKVVANGKILCVDGLKNNRGQTTII